MKSIIRPKLIAWAIDIQSPPPALSCGVLQAGESLSLSPLFSEHMVLQQGVDNRVWEYASAGEDGAITFSVQGKVAMADKRVKLSMAPHSDFRLLGLAGVYGTVLHPTAAK